MFQAQQSLFEWSKQHAGKGCWVSADSVLWFSGMADWISRTIRSLHSPCYEILVRSTNLTILNGILQHFLLWLFQHGFVMCMICFWSVVRKSSCLGNIKRMGLLIVNPVCLFWWTAEVVNTILQNIQLSNSLLWVQFKALETFFFLFYFPLGLRGEEE